MSEVTRILAAMERGDVRAVDKLFPLVYQELRQLAPGFIRSIKQNAPFKKLKIS